jgi:hypothetical protein
MAQHESPTTAELTDWLEGRLTAESAAALTHQIENDPALQEQVAWLRDFLQISQTTILASPPAGVHEGPNVAFAAYAKGKRPSGWLETLVATLTADNWQRPALAGVRNVTLRHEPRQLVYNSDLADVALNAQMQAGSGLVDLSGQIFPLDDSEPTDFLVQLLRDDLEIRLTSCDTLGKFSLTGLPAGTYHLLLSSDRAKIEIGPVVLE